MNVDNMNSNNEIINIRSHEILCDITKDVLARLGYDYRQEYVEIDNDRLRCYCKKQNVCSFCLVYVDVNNRNLGDLYNIFEIDIKNHFIDNGIFITTRVLPIEITNKSERFNVDLVDRHTILGFLSGPTRMKIEPLFVKTYNYQNLRIAVKFQDGTEFCNDDDNKTIIQTIEFIGLEKVRSLALEVKDYPLILSCAIPHLKETIYPIGNGWYIYIQPTLTEKMSLLREINHRLGEPFNVVMADIKKINDKMADTITLEDDTKYLLVSFEDGTQIGEMESAESFIQAIERINPTKMEQKKISSFGQSVISDRRISKRQKLLSNGKWIMIPLKEVDMCESLNILAMRMNIFIETTLI